MQTGPQKITSIFKWREITVTSAGDAILLVKGEEIPCAKRRLLGQTDRER